MLEHKAKILINDACVLFDLIDLNLIEKFFEQDNEFITSLNIYNEFTKTEQKKIIDQYIHSGKLAIDKNAELSQIISFVNKHSVLSYSDCSILELSIRLNAVLITSDKSLRKIASQYLVDVMGILGVIYKLFENALISGDAAIIKLNEYMEINERTPIKETKAMIKTIRNLNK